MQMNILLPQLWQFNFIFSWKWVFGIGQNKRNKLHSCEPRQEATADQQLADLVGPACCCTPETPLALLHHLTIFGDHNSFKIISVICMQPWLNWEEMIKLSSEQHHNQLRKGSVIIQLLNMRVPGESARPLQWNLLSEWFTSVILSLSYLLLSPFGRVSAWSSASLISSVCEDRNIQAEELSPMGLTEDSITTHGIQFSKLRIHDIHFKAVLTRSSISYSCFLFPVPGFPPGAVKQKSEIFAAAKVNSIQTIGHMQNNSLKTYISRKELFYVFFWHQKQPHT